MTLSDALNEIVSSLVNQLFPCWPTEEVLERSHTLGPTVSEDFVE